MRRKGGVRSFLGERASAELGWEICEPATHRIPPFLSPSVFHELPGATFQAVVYVSLQRWV